MEQLSTMQRADATYATYVRYCNSWNNCQLCRADGCCQRHNTVMSMKHCGSTAAEEQADLVGALSQMHV